MLTWILGGTKLRPKLPTNESYEWSLPNRQATKLNLLPKAAICFAVLHLLGCSDSDFSGSTATRAAGTSSTQTSLEPTPSAADDGTAASTGDAEPAAAPPPATPDSSAEAPAEPHNITPATPATPDAEPPADQPATARTPVPINSIDPEVIANLCLNPGDNAVVTSFEKELKFAPLTGDCNWNDASVGNVKPRNGFMTGHRTQSQKILDHLPTDTTFCTMDVITVAKTNNQGDAIDFSYDDFLFMNLGDIVLLASNGFTDDLTMEDDLLIFDWSRLVNLAMFNRQYCIEEIGPACDFPEHSTSNASGAIHLELPTSKLLKVLNSPHAYRNSTTTDGTATKELWLNLVVIGDNDSASDCRHNGLDLRLKGSFIQVFQ